ncbi:UDP-glucuronic acid decarboxylase 5 [Glycine soja]
MLVFFTMATNSSNGATKQPPMPSPLRFSKFFQSNMRILVTGGAGFIGSHLVDKLMENEKNEVIVADNFFTGSKDNLKKWIGHPRFELIRHDVTEQLLIEVDQIYHLACPASPIFYKYNPVKTIKTNVIGTLNMLGLAKRVGARILLTSTSEVYGDPLEHPQPESYWGNVNPIGVRSCYDEGKRVAETLMFDYHRQHGIEIRIARIFNTYGPRMNIDDGRVVSNFIAQAIRGEPLTVQVPGTQTRSFCYVSDMVDGLIRLMEGENTGPINIGNPGEFTMIELAENVKELINPKVEINMVENTPDDPRQRKPDITKAKELLGWEPKVKLRDGLPLMEEDFRQRLGVIVADNYFTGSKDNLKKWIGHPRFELIRHDVTEPLTIEVDQIYHLACPASPIFYKYNPVKTIKTNVIGTLNMLGLAKRVGARILLTSTSEVYGDPLVHPQPESYWGNVNPIGVRSCYDEGKRVAETLMFDYHRQHGIEIRVARIFNTYGPRMNIDDGRVVSNFIAQAIRCPSFLSQSLVCFSGEPLTVQSPGTQTRSFCYVSDLVDGLIRLMEGSDTGPINLGNPGEFTMLELAETVKELINPDVEIKVVENTPDDPRQRKPIITKAMELLGWEPKY